MGRFTFPVPVLDAREIDLLEKLTEEYQRFASPRMASKSITALRKGMAKITPEKLRSMAAQAVNAASEWEFIKQALEHAGHGFIELTKHTSSFTISHDSAIRALNSAGCCIDTFEQICATRSYHIEQVVSKRKHRDLLAAFSEGAATGAPGLAGVPFNMRYPQEVWK